MNSSNTKFELYYFLGIGGIGMSAIARYFHAQKKLVMGYDRTQTVLTQELELEGIPIHYTDSELEIPQLVKSLPKEKVLVIYTPAIPALSIELNWFRSHDFTIRKRSEVLGIITETERTIAVAGTHGKTTTSALIAHILTSSGHGCNAFLGGIAANYDTNLLLSPGAEWTVVEADEFDRSFLTLTPTLAVITSTDADHLDIYGTHEYMVESFNLFAERVKPNGNVIIKKGLPINSASIRAEINEYSIQQEADFYAKDITLSEGVYRFTLVQIKNGKALEYEGMELGLAGRHNTENAVAASAIALMAGVNPEKLRTALSTFKGVRRRFEYVLKQKNMVFIDDYAHHPEELRACISSVKEMYSGKKVTGIFQPHLFTRTRDFADEFARSLELLDEIILLPIYPARELPIPGIDSQMLLDKLVHPSKKLVEKDALLDELNNNDLEVLITLGAGDIDTLVKPIASQLLKKSSSA